MFGNQEESRYRVTMLEKSLQGKLKYVSKMYKIVIHSVTFTIFDHSSPRYAISFKVIKITRHKHCYFFFTGTKQKQKQKKNKIEQTQFRLENLDRN